MTTYITPANISYFTDAEVLLNNEAELRSAYGGKGFGLALLHSYLNDYTPTTYVIDRRYSPLHIDNIELLLEPLIYSEVKYWAVRSSGRVSMPGMMDTKLRVPNTYEDLSAAIKAVWESWNNPEAKAYRAANGIDEGEGTAVIVQEFLEPVLSGVIFTGNAQDPLAKGVFKPTISFVVNQTGDKLVSGEVTPYESSLSVPNIGYPMGTVYSHVKMLFQNLKDSDIEFVLPRPTHMSGPFNPLEPPKDHEESTVKEWFTKVLANQELGVYYVQWRPLKFPKKEFAALPGRGKVITYGHSIGAPACVIAKLSKQSKFTPGDALYVDSFAPELYELYTKASAIVTNSGGFHCHAGIVARELGLPAISGVNIADFPPTVLKKDVYIDGKEGAVFLVEDRELLDVSKVEVNTVDDFPINKRVLHGVMSRLYCKENLPSIEPTKLAFRFYYAIDQHSKGKITLEHRNKVINELALVLNNYVVGACTGESRHINKACGGWPFSVSLVRGLVDEFAAQKTYGAKVHKLLRDNLKGAPSEDATDLEAIKMALAKSKTDELSKAYLSMIGYMNMMQLKELRGVIVDSSERATVFSKVPTLNNQHLQLYLRDLSFIFSGNWGSSYGGIKWRNLVDFCAEFVSGKVPPIFFIDHMLNMEHNGGTVFGKLSWFADITYSVKQFLNHRRDSHNFEDVIEAVAPAFTKEHLEHGVTNKGLKFYPVFDLNKTFLPQFLWDEMVKPVINYTTEYEDKIHELVQAFKGATTQNATAK